jgi:hypothetical protein
MKKSVQKTELDQNAAKHPQLLETPKLGNVSGGAKQSNVISIIDFLQCNGQKSPPKP